MPPKAKLYNLQPEHQARFGEWRDRWIANAMSTAAMTDDDRQACIAAVHGLYAAAKLPAPKHIVFVPSPFVLAFAGGFAAARWHLFKTRSATYAATRSATLDATYAATRSATLDATYAATLDATLDAKNSKKVKSPSETSFENWYVVPGDLRRCADELSLGAFGLACAAQAYRMWQGGNQWSGYDAFLSFFQDVARLPLDYSAYNHWRTLAERSGPRIVHRDFCMICDRPELLTVDDRRRPHGEDGPFCRWRDGTELYAWHGTRVPARWIINRASLDPVEVLKQRDVERRAAGVNIIGMVRMLDQLGYSLIDADPDPSHGELIEVSGKKLGLPRPGRFLKAECPRNGTIVEGVPDHIATVHAAQAWRLGLEPHEFSYPTHRT